MTTPTPTAATPDSLAKLRAETKRIGNAPSFLLTETERRLALHCHALQSALDALSAQQAAGDARAVETGWLVEQHDELRRITYLSIDNNAHNGPYIWTPNHMKACRFARRVDAESAAEGGEILDLRIVEHQWTATQPEPRS